MILNLFYDEPMRDHLVPVIILASTDPLERDVALLTALLNAPGYVAIIHELPLNESGEPELIRRVITPEREQRVSVPLEHACPGCAMREDAVPAIVEQLQDEPAGIVLALPLGAEILPATRTLAAAIRCGALNGARLAGTVASLSTSHMLDALDEGDEAIVAHIISASILVTSGGGRAACDVIDALRSAASSVLPDPCEPWLERAAALSHDDEALERICHPQTMTPGHGLREGTALADGTTMTPSGVWEMHLRSALPFHPERLLAAAQTLGAHGAISRGRFWVPNRPDELCAWDSVSGQVSIGVVDRWHRADRDTCLHVVGFDADPATVRSAFASALLTEDEHRAGAVPWLGRTDPLLSYLGEYGSTHDLDGAS